MCQSRFDCLVGMRGFEPPTPSSRTKCATRLRYIPKDGYFREQPFSCQGKALQ